MSKVYLLLGSNEGDKLRWLRKGVSAINRQCGDIPLISAIYQTGAWGLEDQEDFYNLVLELHTDLTPHQLLEQIQLIEEDLGRQRKIKWGPRSLDIDILFFDDLILNDPQLKIPHPFLKQRRFTLAPLEEIAPHLIHPIDRKSIRQLLLECPDPLPVTRTTISMPE
jgi:2-amino-4-hydroxy-6-hydroxymethyldihydropteridine diphosphokinase